jgi:cytoskeleton protein RodZ
VTAPAGRTVPDAPPVPATGPEAGPESPIAAGQTYALARSDAPASPATTATMAAKSPDQGPGGESGAPATDAAAGARQDRLAALPLDPAVIGPVGQIEGRENTDARVVLKALESSWIQISSPAGAYLRSRTLEPNDVFLVPNRPDLELWTGNAGGLEVIVDGTVLAPLGTSGAVLRNVSLDPSSLRTRLGPPRQR